MDHVRQRVQTNSEKTQCPVIVNNYQTGMDSFIELLREASHSHKNYRAAHNATEAEHSPRNEDLYTRTHQQSDWTQGLPYGK